MGELENNMRKPQYRYRERFKCAMGIHSTQANWYRMLPPFSVKDKPYDISTPWCTYHWVGLRANSFVYRNPRVGYVTNLDPFSFGNIFLRGKCRSGLDQRARQMVEWMCGHHYETFGRIPPHVRCGSVGVITYNRIRTLRGTLRWVHGRRPIARCAKIAKERHYLRRNPVSNDV